MLLSANHSLAQSGDVVISSNTTWPAGQYTLTSLTVTSGATLTLQSANASGQVDGQWQGYGVTITAGTVRVDAGSAISANAQGYTGGATGAPGNGPGGGCGSLLYDSAGGSHGGVGYGTTGCSAGPIYGSALTPTDLGSGGGGTTTCAGGVCAADNVGGSGGGAIRLIVTGTLTNNGTISANGGDGRYNWFPLLDSYAVGGSGGSIWATIGTLTGSGVFMANGGLQYWNGEVVHAGGGGRIAVYYGVNGGFTGFNTSTVNGGPGASQGTIAFFNTTANDLLVTGPHVFIYGENSSLAFHDITVRDAATLIVGGGSTISATGTITVTGNSTITLQGKNTTAQVGGQWVGQGVTVTAANVHVDAGSSISANAQGYTGGATGYPGNGPGGGCGSLSDSAGGSYGGVGYGYAGCSAGPIYGSAMTPTDLGSGGGGNTTCAGGFCYADPVGGNGGGAIRLIVTGTLTNNGTISANGGDGRYNWFPSLDSYAVGGSGGSIWATVGTLTGSGVFTANGGVRHWNEQPVSGGGGGRVAVYYSVNDGFTGFNTSTANGGPGAEPGTVAFIDRIGNDLEVTGGQTFAINQDSVASFADVTIHNGSRLIIGGGATLNVTGALVVSGNSTIVAQAKSKTGQVNGQWVGQGVTIAAASMQVEAGSAISADAQGYTGGATDQPGNGPGGGGGTFAYDSAGGSYGGLGMTTACCAAGPTYGSALTPTDLGSGAGGAANSVGGNGGGAIRLIVTGTLANNGTISANGGNGGIYSGGGSGGSIWATLGTLTGSGSFKANGGSRIWDNNPAYPGGGGGRLAIYYNVDGGFAGFAASTANGGVSAEAGTVNFIQYFHLTVGKEGNGAGTVASSPAGVDCGAACATTFNSGTPVTLAATPATGSVFSGWSGDSDCSDGVLTMTANRSCTATFTLLTFALTVTKTGPGSVTADVAGVDCGATCTADYNYGTLVTLTATPAPGARFVGWSGEGCSGTGTCAVTVTQARNLSAPFAWNPHAVGAFRPTDGTFYLDYNGNGAWDGCGTDRCLSIGMLGDIPLVGDWNGTGTSKVGAFRPTDGTFYLDYNGNGVWDGCGTDRCLQIGLNGDIPLVGDWDGTLFAKVGVFRPADGTFYLDYNGNGVWDGCGTDRCLQIGMTGDVPLVGDWNGNGTAKVGVFRPSDGAFYLDYNGNGAWDGCGTDRCLAIGLAGDLPFVGDWDGSGSGKVGLFRPSDGTFYLDSNGNGAWDGCGTDRCLSIGLAGDTPLIGDWDGTGFAKVGVFRPSDGTFYLDYNGSGTWEGCGTDRCLSIGLNGDTPLVGKW